MHTDNPVVSVDDGTLVNSTPEALDAPVAVDTTEGQGEVAPQPVEVVSPFLKEGERVEIRGLRYRVASANAAKVILKRTR